MPASQLHLGVSLLLSAEELDHPALSLSFNFEPSADPPAGWVEAAEGEGNTFVCRLGEAAGSRVRVWFPFFGVSTFFELDCCQLPACQILRWLNRLV